MLITKKFYNFHMVSESPWPILASIASASFIISLFSLMNLYSIYYMIFSGIFLLLVVGAWFRDIIRESVYQGNHTKSTVKTLKFGLFLFILSEVMLFVSFFWTFFHSSLNPAMEIGNVWPSWGIQPINPFNIPLLNTLILVSSGVSITFSHHQLLNNNLSDSLSWLFLTIFLGFYFSSLQMLEYKYSSFTIMDSIYGSIFFLSTGFHGAHVIVGSILILVSAIRLFFSHFSNSHHLLFEFSCWYWHFVDLVWLFLFIFIYWWGW